MRIIGICGSPRKSGNTEVMVKEALRGAKEAGADVELIHLGDLKLEFCDGCLSCDETGRCHIEDGMNKINERLAVADGFVIGTPTRYGLLSGQLKVFIDRTCPLSVPEKLKGKKAVILAVGQCKKSDWSIGNALKTIKDFCESAGIGVVGEVIGAEAYQVGDIKKQSRVLKDCHKLGQKLVKSLL